jgi:16S rRNA (guanine527-N7)-methyltransferase
MTPEQIRALLEPYLNPLPSGIEVKVQKYIDLLDKWGAHMSLTSIRDPVTMVRFHFGESIFALSMPTVGNGRLADVGSGAGFPGLALKLANPSLSLALIEPNKKKCAFLHEAVRSLELNDVQIVPTEFGASHIENQSLSSISCRALGQHRLLLGWAKEKLVEGGSILLWIGDRDADTIRTEHGWEWDSPVLIPAARERFLLRGRRVP